MAEMQASPALVSHALAAVAHLGLVAVLAAGWRRRRDGIWLLGAAAATVAWAALTAAYTLWPQQRGLLLGEPLRHGAWAAFLLWVLRTGVQGRPSGVLRGLGIAAAAVVGLETAALAAYALGLLGALGGNARYLLFIPGLVAGVMLLTLTEQLWRNARGDRRWAMKHLCIAVAAMGAYDVFLYGTALLVGGVHAEAWAARGGVVAVLAPLVAVTAARNPQWSLDVFVSRRMAMHTASLTGAGLYLLGMAAAGQWIRATGGTWGDVAQIVFLVAAAVFLVLLFSSGRARAWLRVFLLKHFFTYRYDYRDEWLRLTEALSAPGGDAAERLPVRVVRALADIVESPGGALWRRDGRGYEPAGGWNATAPGTRVGDSDPLVRFIAERGWVVDLEELRRHPERYEGLDAVPAWLAGLQRARFVVPLQHRESLAGFVVLLEPRVPLQLDWETRDLLKTAGRQAASYLVLEQAAEALTQARQFEAFNRLAAVVVHDLKNLIAQLELVVRNAERHRGNPEFMEDAMATVANAVARMGRLMGQLRSARAHMAGEPVNLSDAVQRAVAARQAGRPRPVLEAHEPGLWIRADRERLQAVVEHVIQNAQEATADDGSVRVRLRREGRREAVVEVEDDGCGMTAEFVRERLFRPFDTTKGVTGMGIGAHEAREFARAAGGDVEVESEPGKGTVFRIRLPLAAVDVGVGMEAAS